MSTQLLSRCLISASDIVKAALGIGTFSLSRASLGVCCALIACCVVAETLLRRQSGHVLSYLLIPCLALVSLALLPCMPQSGAWLAVTLYCVGLVSPFPMSYSYKCARHFERG